MPDDKLDIKTYSLAEVAKLVLPTRQHHVGTAPREVTHTATDRDARDKLGLRQRDRLVVNLDAFQ
jgi:hypothetical protein